MAKKRVLIVDDDREIVRLVRGYLEQAGHEVLVAYDGDTTIHMLRRELPDLLLLDLMLPDKDGWDITRFIRADDRLEEMPIIMMTARVDDIDKIIGLELGADDYITKPFNPRELVARVNALLRRSQMGENKVNRQIIQIGSLHMDTGLHVVQCREEQIDLTPTEFALLRTMMENPKYVFTRSELVQRSLGYEYEGLERTLDSHIKNLRQKIEINPKHPQVIQTVYGVGYRLVASDED